MSSIAQARVTSESLDRTPLQHTLGHLACPACESVRQRIMDSAEFGTLSFPHAAQLWLESRKAKLGARSYIGYEHYIKALTKFFGMMSLNEIHIGHVSEYQQYRGERAGASLLNHEMSCLGQIMKRAGLWAEIKKFYEPMPLPQGSPGFAMEDEEEQHLFHVAARNPRWKLAYCAAIISNATTAGPSEIVNLRLGDIRLANDPPVICVREGTKNKYRVRTIPLNRDAVWAIRELMDRAIDKGAELPEHYLFPHRAAKRGMPPDVTRPMGSWKKAWYALRKEAGKRYPRLLTIRRYDLRHNAATKLLENPDISERTIEEMMGHKLNSRVKERYSHIRLEARKAASEALQAGHVPGPRRLPPRGENVVAFGQWKRK